MPVYYFLYPIGLTHGCVNLIYSAKADALFAALVLQRMNILFCRLFQMQVGQKHVWHRLISIRFLVLQNLEIYQAL